MGARGGALAEFGVSSGYRGTVKKSEFTKLATATSVERIQKYVNEYACSSNYRVHPDTLAISNATAKVPDSWFVINFRGGFLFGRKK
jgi:hypothetical protein